MKTVLAYLHGLLEDPLFVRVCMFLWGLPLALVGFSFVLMWKPSEGWEWFAFFFLFLVGCLGAYLVYIAVFGASSSLDRASNYLSDGGDIMGAILSVVVVLVALPTTALVRAMRSQPRKR